MCSRLDKRKFWVIYICRVQRVLVISLERHHHKIQVILIDLRLTDKNQIWVVDTDKLFQAMNVP